MRHVNAQHAAPPTTVCELSRRRGRARCAAQLPEVAERRRRGDHRRGPELHRRVQRADGRDDPQRRAARARRLPLPGQRRPRRRPAHPDRAGRRGRLPARPRRGPQRPHDRRAARGVPHRRPGLVAGDVDDRGPQRPRRPRCWPTSPSWSSPTSTSCRRPASPATPTRPRPPAGSGSGCSSGSPHLLLDGAPADEVAAAAERAGWAPPTTLTAVLVPESQVRPVLGLVAGRRPSRPPTTPGLDEARAAAGARRARPRRRAALLRTLARPRLASPARPCRGWRCARRTTARSGPASSASSSTPRPTCPAWCCTPTRPRSPTCAPGPWPRSPGCGPAPPRSSPTPCAPGCCYQGRRDEVAAALFVHPQTVRYRMGQLRDLYGDRLDDPDTVLALTLALA